MIETAVNDQMSVDEVQKNKPDEVHDSDSNADLSRTEDKTASMLTQDNPPTSQMVLSALTTLKRKKGISYQAIKKFISATYKKDVKKLSPYVKRFLRSAVSCGILHQVTGKGARGSFKLVKRQRISTSYRRASSNPSRDNVLNQHNSENFHSNEGKKVPRLIRKSRNLSSRGSHSDNSLHKSTSTSQLFIRKKSSLSDLAVKMSDKNISVSTSTDGFMCQTFSVPSTRSSSDVNRRSSRTNISTGRIESFRQNSLSSTSEPSSMIVDVSSVEDITESLTRQSLLPGDFTSNM